MINVSTRVRRFWVSTDYFVVSIAPIEWVEEELAQLGPEHWRQEIASSPEVVMLHDDDLADLLFAEAQGLGKDASMPRVVSRNLMGVYVPNHRTGRLVWIDCSSPQVWQYNHARPLMYTALAGFLLREKALAAGVVQHAGMPTDNVGLSTVRDFGDDECLVERVLRFRRKRLMLWNQASLLRDDESPNDPTTLLGPE